jgi:DHA2 family multidrug resistance protein-like MFS transporter
MTTEPTTRKAGRREWIGLAVIALPCVLYSMDLTVLNLALPSLSEDLKPTSTELLWIVDIYGFMVAGSLITMGTLGDRIGRRKLLLIGAAAFGVASVLAAFSNTSGMLILTRALLGIAGATLAPSTLSLIRNMFHDENQRTFAIGVWATSYSVGGAIGPLLGGLMLQQFWWGSVFLLGVPVMLLLLIVGPKLLPEFRDPNAGRLDIISAAMSLCAVLAIIYGLKLIAQDGLGWLSFTAIVAGIITGLLFLTRQKKLKDPFIDLNLFGSRRFNAALLTNTLVILVAFGSFFFIAQYLQLVLGLTPLQAGLWTMPSSLGFVAASMLTPAISQHVKPSHIMGGGLLLAALGFGLLTQIEEGGLTILVIGSVVYALGICPSIILSTDLIVGSVPPERSGSAASLSETSSELGGALGIAILGSVGTAVYRSFMKNADPPGIPVSFKAEASETLGGAAAVAEQLSSTTKAELLATSQQAFTHAFEWNSLISGIIATSIAIVVVVMLRNAKTSSE